METSNNHRTNEKLSTEIHFEHGITGFQYIAYTRPMVYLWTRGIEVLYVGCSRHGIKRIFNNKHRAIKRERMHRNDFIKMKFFTDVELMRKEETRLIKRYNPIYNREIHAVELREKAKSDSNGPVS